MEVERSEDGRLSGRGRARAGWGLLGAVLLALLAAWAVQAIAPSVQPLKLTPVEFTVEPDSGLPSEVRALEAETLERLFDRDTLTDYTAYGNSRIAVDFDREQRFDGLKLYGSAPYRLSVQAKISGSFRPVSGLQDLDLSKLDERWHRFDADTAATLTQLRIDLEPLNGSASAGLRELEFWGQAQRVPAGDGEALLRALSAEIPAQQARVYAASPGQGVIGADTDAADDLDDNTFSLPLDYAPESLKRAWLVYEIQGFGHWISPQRRLNGGPAQGGAFRFAGEEWITQLESVNPAWLRKGSNRVEFNAPATGIYAVRNLRLLIELEDGGNFVARTEAWPNDTANDPAHTIDGDLVTGWRPYGGQPGPSDKPHAALHFDRPTEVEGVELSLVNSLDGDIQIELLKDGAWKSAAQPPIKGRDLTTGWNRIEVRSTEAVDGLRLNFNGGSNPAAELVELALTGSGVGPRDGAPHIVLSYPDRGQYYGRNAYLRGYLQPADNGSGPARLFVAGREVSREDGAIEALVSKDEAGFADSADAEPWSVTIDAVYPDGQRLSLPVELTTYQDPGIAEGLANYIDPSVHAPKAAVGNTGNLEHDEARLEVDADAMDPPRGLTIRPLGPDELPPLNPGMTNVTKGPRGGYRFGPHGMRFKKNIKVTMPYDPRKIPAGQGAQDVKSFYFDEELGRWVPLERAALNPGEESVTSLTDHFTDMINATVTVPEHPQAASFNPTQIKDIKAADPGAGINLIEPPEANNMGDARLSYPLEVPPGRAGMQPQLAVQYNSSGGNGWLGLGWDLSVPSISIETRWGVPRYDAGKETETYLLNGEMLTPVAHRTDYEDLDPRTSERVFHARVEGQFRKIVRFGDNPTNYRWEVTDKNGTKHLYGGVDASDNRGKLGGEKGVFKWMLVKSIDTNGNNTIYEYDPVCDTGTGDGGNANGDATCDGGVPGYQLYLKTIHYTGTGAEKGPFAVTFVRDRELDGSRRPDISIDARGGFKQVMAERLREIRVEYAQSENVRRYEFDYEQGAFAKSLLSQVVQYGADGTEFNRHSFTYHDEVRPDGAAYAGFGEKWEWNSGDDNLGKDFLGLEASLSALGGTEGDNDSSDTYVGFALLPKKDFSVGRKIARSSTKNDGLVAMVDLNGDGLPDKVFDCKYARDTEGDCEGSRYAYRPNTASPGADLSELSFGGLQPLRTLTAISKERTRVSSGGNEAYLGVASISSGGSSFITQSAYFSDVNGDGFTDLVTDGVVYFNRLVNGVPTFNPDSSDTPAGIDQSQGVLGDGTLPDFSELKKQLLNESPLMDAVRSWVAPYSGDIRVTGHVRLLESDDPARPEYTTADGVRVAVQFKGTEKWHAEIGADETGPDDGKTHELILRNVKKGDRLYFRVQSKFDGLYDEVNWNPSIEYLGTSDEADVNLLPVYSFSAADDFVFAGRTAPQKLPFRGKIRIVGDLEKTGITTDDIELRIYLLTEQELQALSGFKEVPALKEPVFARKLDWYDETGTISFEPEVDDIAVERDSFVVLSVHVDSNVDLKQIQWQPRIFYVEAYSPDVQPTDKDGNPVDGGFVPGAALPVTNKDGDYTIEIDPIYDIDFYPANNAGDKPQSAWEAPRDGVVYVMPSVELRRYPVDCDFWNVLCEETEAARAPDGDVAFTVKKPGEQLFKQVIRIRDRAVEHDSQGHHALAVIPVKKDDQLFFDFSARDPQLAKEIEQANVSWTYATENGWRVPLSDKVSVSASYSALEEYDDDGNPVGIHSEGVFVIRSDTEVVHKEVVSIPTFDAADFQLPLDAREDEELFFELVTDQSFRLSRHDVTTVYRQDAAWTAPRAGTVAISPLLGFKDAPVPDGQVRLRVYRTRDGVRVGDRTYDVRNGEVRDSQQPLLVNVAADEILRFDYYTRHHGMASHLADKGRVQLNYADNDSWTVPFSDGLSKTWDLEISPLLELAPGTGAEGEVVFQVQDEGRVLASRSFAVTDGVPHLEDEVPIRLSASSGSDLQLVYVTDDATLAAAITQHKATVVYGSNSVELESDVLVMERIAASRSFSIDMPDEAPSTEVLAGVVHTTLAPSAFPQEYRGWGYIGYNGNDSCTQKRALGETSPCEEPPIDESRFKVSGKRSDYDITDPNKTPKSRDMYLAIPVAHQDSWISEDVQWRIGRYTMTASRLGGLDYISVPEEKDFQGAVGIPRITRSNQSSFGAGVYVTLSSSDSTNHTLLDFVDLNGDRYPDIVSGQGLAQFTLPTGRLDAAQVRFSEVGSIGQTGSHGNTISPGGTVPDAVALAKNIIAGLQGKTPAKPDKQSPPFGFSGSLGQTDNTGNVQLLDLNGDGLPDMVRHDKATGLHVRLNTGYDFADEEFWSPGALGSGESLNGSLGVSAGFSDGVRGYSGGANLSYSESATEQVLTDLNGDGLVDLVYDDGGLQVALNTGAGFARAVRWSGSKDLGEGKNVTFGVGGSMVYTIGPLCPLTPLCYILINPAKSLSASLSRTEDAFRDIDGDGYVDYLNSDNDRIDVYSNRTGRTNLLKTVKRPLGAGMDFEYERVGNTYTLPQSRWVLSKVSVFDGVENDRPSADADVSSDEQVTVFAYEDGLHDRYERDFLGFRTVTTTQLDTSGSGEPTTYRRTVQTFLNQNVYERGLLESSVVEGVTAGEAGEYVRTENEYVFEEAPRPDGGPALMWTRDEFANLDKLDRATLTVFPQLTKTTKSFSEGGKGLKETITEHEYDRYGNVVLFHDGGDADTDADDVWAHIQYTGAGDLNTDCAAAYIVGKPDRIEVLSSAQGGETLRLREAEFDCTRGNLTAVRESIGPGSVAVTNLAYDNLGNLAYVEGPPNDKQERLELRFKYDDATHTHVERIDNDSYQYFSTATHDVRWGKPLSTTDTNGNTITYTYDDFGRTRRVTAPKDADQDFTIQFTYTPYVDLDGTPFVSWAKTEHFDRDAQGTGTIDTYLFTDGLKRVLQTKKDATVEGSEVMIVSGRIALDAFGRTVRQYYPTTEPKGGSNAQFNRDHHRQANPTEMSYDVMDRVLSTVLPDGTTTSMAYDFGNDAEGRNQFLTTVTDAAENQKETYRDTRELITTVKEYLDGEALVTRYSYDRLKQIRQVFDAAGKETTVSYDGLGRRTEIKNLDTGLTEYRYDPAGNLIEKITANLREQGEGAAINYIYDHTRLLEIHYPSHPENNVSYVYGGADKNASPEEDKARNQVGRIKRVTHQGGQEERIYGALGEVVEDTKTLASGPAYRVFTTAYDYDSFGRVLSLTLPDGEVLTHRYDAGGNLDRISSEKQGAQTVYLEKLEYDAFEQRTEMRLGNGIHTRYRYDPITRRLCRLESGRTLDQDEGAICKAPLIRANQPGEDAAAALANLSAAPAEQFQNLHYAYDQVGNIRGLGNAVQVPRRSEYGGPAVQSFDYDNLYRLIGAAGVYTEAANRRHTYDLAMAYDNIHNITRKTQEHLRYTGDKARPQRGTTYDWAYKYAGPQPHAPTLIGERAFHYDANGNQTGWDHTQNGTRRSIEWDDENRIQAINDPGNTLRFKYDDQGMRTQKRGQHGETVYVNQWYTVRNGAITSKHIFAGTSRIATRVITAEQAPRERELDGSESLGGLTVETTSVMGTSSPDTGTSSAPPGKSTLGKAANDSTFADSGHPGKGLANRSERANEVARNTEKNPNLSGSHPGQGLENRSDRANERAKNTEKNPNLIDGGDGGDGGTPPDTGNPGGGNGGGSSGGSAGAGADFLYYYHPDHLGSTGYVTDDQGQLYEHVLYFPFGETWVEQASNTWRTPYLFTSKELDPETGLYYFGARYYDPRTSVWQSPDPILEKYLPQGSQTDLVAGGVFNSPNLGLYSYGHQRPLIAKDPDGNFVFITIAVVGAAITAYDTYQTYNEAGGGSEGLKAAGKTLAVDGVITLATGGAGKLAHKGYKAYKQSKQKTGVVYKRTDPKTGEEYVGQAKSPERFDARQGEHDKKLGVQHEYEVLGKEKPGKDLDVLEETKIRERGGLKKEGGTLANKRHQMSEQRYREAGGNVDDPNK